MSLKLSVIGLAVAAIGLSATPVARAGGDYEPTQPAPRYNEAPQQEQVYEAPPASYYPAPVVTIGFFPSFGYYGFGYPYGYYRRHHRYYGGHHYYARGGYPHYAHSGYARGFHRR